MNVFFHVISFVTFSYYYVTVSLLTKTNYFYLLTFKILFESNNSMYSYNFCLHYLPLVCLCNGM